MFKPIEIDRKARQLDIKKLKEQQQNTSSHQDLVEDVVNTQNEDVENAFHLQKQINKEMSEYREQVKNHQQVSQQWVSMLDNLERTLKELGDFESFLYALQKQAQELAQTLEQRAKG